MEAFLVIALIVSNIGWLIYADRRDKREQDERSELQNRIAEPSLIVPPKEVVKKRLQATANSKPDPEFDPDIAELSAVGRIDPDGILREN